MANLAHSMVTHQDIKSASILHGRKYESIAVEQFREKWKMACDECGLFISQDHPQLAASPDRLIGDDSVLEIKCPYMARNMPISPHTVP